MPTFPNISQSIYNCGVICILIISKYYDREVKDKLLYALNSEKYYNINLLELSNLANSVGFDSIAVNISFSDLIRKTPLPTIVLLNNKHFVVLYKIDSEKVYISDPMNGLTAYSISRFIKYWISNDADINSKGGICLIILPS
ncbi:MAG: cysteine peptidase family C39 domain-containing protein [Bacteroidetes bacterium]|nr:cysteine peptidase family C39 domain-containing protein [Bacteroidota bacterium]